MFFVDFLRSLPFGASLRHNGGDVIDALRLLKSIPKRTDSVAFGRLLPVSACVRTGNLHNSLTVYHTSHNTYNAK